LALSGTLRFLLVFAAIGCFLVPVLLVISSSQVTVSLAVRVLVLLGVVVELVLVLSVVGALVLLAMFLVTRAHLRRVGW
jgi:hypothetical protein